MITASTLKKMVKEAKVAEKEVKKKWLVDVFIPAAIEVLEVQMVDAAKKGKTAYTTDTKTVLSANDLSTLLLQFKVEDEELIKGLRRAWRDAYLKLKVLENTEPETEPNPNLAGLEPVAPTTINFCVSWE